MRTYYGASIREYDDGNVVTLLLGEKLSHSRPRDKKDWNTRWFQMIGWFSTPEEAEAVSMGRFI
jgi:hypothetical protein